MTAADPPLRFGPFLLDVANARLTREGEPLVLPPKAFALLACLARRPGQLVSKDELLDTVWGRRFVSEGVIKTVVSELRAALDDDPRQPRWIETVSRRGYRFVGGQPTVPAAPGPTPPPAPQDHAPIGRDDELALLHAAWHQAQSGQRRLVLVGGEPGVGKSTLLAAFVASLPHGRVASGQCVEAYGSSEPYLPALDALGSLCALEPALVGTVRRCAPTWLVQMPWLVTDADRAMLQQEVSGATQDRMLREMGVLLEQLALEQPLLLVLEDLHWSDTATLRLLDALARRRGPAALMIVCSHRPADAAIADHPFGDLRREWRLHRLAEELTLEGLDAHGLRTLLEQRYPGVGLDADFVQALLMHTEGLPLFVIGVLDELVDDGVVARGPEGRWGLARRPSAQLPVPASLAGVIEKQFMRLAPEVQSLLETAALAAPQFRHIHIAEAMGLPAEDVRDHLESLLRRQIWLRAAGVGELPDGRWTLQCTFTHALVRRTLAQRVGASLRVERHRRLADSLERSWGKRIGEVAGELVMHAESGREPLRAARHCALAARNALQRHAAREALTMTLRGLAQTEALPEATRAAAELPLLALRITATLLTDGLSSPAARPLVAQALALVQDLAVTRDTAVLWHVALLVHVTGRLPGTAELAQRFLDGAEAGRDPLCRAAAHNMVGVSKLHTGHVIEAITHYEQALALCDQNAEGSAGVLTRDPRIEALSYLCLCETVAGRFTRAQARSAALDALIERGTDLIGEGLGRWFQVYAHFFRRDATAARPLGEHCVALLESRQVLPALQPHRMALGWARAAHGDLGDGAALARLGLERYLAQGSRQGLVGLHALVAQTLRLAGDEDGARACVQAGLAVQAELGDGFALSELHRLQGELDAAADPHAVGAETALRTAVALAHQQQAILLEVLAWSALARFLASRDRLDEARDGVTALLARCEPDADVPAVDALRDWLASTQTLAA